MAYLGLNTGDLGTIRIEVTDFPALAAFVSVAPQTSAAVETFPTTTVSITAS